MGWLNIYNKYCKYRTFWILYAFMYLCLMLLTTVAFYTIYPSPSPIIFIDGSVNTTRRNETVEVTYIRKFEVKYNFVGTVHREMIHTATGYRYEIAGFHRSFTKGEYVRTRTLIMPAGSPSGLYELKTYVVWKPVFSLVEHITEIPDMRFKVCEKFVICGGETNESD